MKAAHLFSLTILVGVAVPSIARIQVSGRIVSDRTKPTPLGQVEDVIVAPVSGLRHASETRNKDETRERVSYRGDLTIQRCVSFGIFFVAFLQVPRCVCD